MRVYVPLLGLGVDKAIDEWCADNEILPSKNHKGYFDKATSLDSIPTVTNDWFIEMSDEQAVVFKLKFGL